MSRSALPPWPADLAGTGPLRPLAAVFFARPTAQVARDLLGCTLLSRAGGAIAGGRIVEIEAYLGSHDEGSHASTRGITRRNAVMYGPPGVAYVYFTYGAHHMLNLVCELEGTAGAVLVRAVEPLVGVEEMAARRGRTSPRELASGPGRLAEALAVDLSDNGTRLVEARLAVFAGPPPAEAIATTGRVGLTRGHEAELRFHLEGNPYVSAAQPGPRAPSRGRGTRTKGKT